MCVCLGLKSIFEKGWIPASSTTSTPTDRFPVHEEQFWDSLRGLRYEINKVIELARRAKLVGASQECKVYLHIENIKSDEVMSLNNRLRAMQGDVEGILPAPKSTNSIDDLRFLFLTSQIEFLESPENVSGKCPDFNQMSELEVASTDESGTTVTTGRKVTIGISKADGLKCQRCWYYSTNVGGSSQEEYKDLCLRCADVVQSLSQSVVITK